MQTDLSVKERLSNFWNFTAIEVSRKHAHPIDHSALDDPQTVGEYADSITKYLLESEHNNLPSPHYMGVQ